jgi:hypothetical protein
MRWKSEYSKSRSQATEALTAAARADALPDDDE